ncbi:unnamed protein product [Discosporangium mesarthrocarpum]
MGVSMMMQMLLALSAVVGSSHGVTEEDLMAFPSSREPRRLTDLEGNLLFQQLARTIPIEEKVFQWCQKGGFKCCKLLNNCNDGSTENICLKDHELPAKYHDSISDQKLVTGWFTWGIQRHVKGVYSMLTIIGDPMDRYISSLEHRFRAETAKLAFAEVYLPQAIALDFKAPGGLYKKVTGNLWKLVDREWLRDIALPSDEDMERAVVRAKANLDTYWMVGVENQETGFAAVLQSQLDPDKDFEQIWSTDMRRKDHFTIKTDEILRCLDADLVQRVNTTLRFEWDVYEYALGLYEKKCREVLPFEQHEELCVVPTASG